MVECGFVDDSYQYYKHLFWRLLLPFNSFLCMLFPQFAEILCFAFNKKTAHEAAELGR